ncbi:hypothetical protein, partial [Enterococcus faecalis]|uniref:hypothetical protein n=1 Tax=Enterococcus faecalis TaxID=1351 RepID=UPI003CC5DBA8
LKADEILFHRLGEQVNDEAPLLEVVAKQFGKRGDHLRGELRGDVGVYVGRGVHDGACAMKS